MVPKVAPRYFAAIVGNVSNDFDVFSQKVSERFAQAVPVVWSHQSSPWDDAKMAAGNCHERKSSQHGLSNSLRRSVGLSRSSGVFNGRQIDEQLERRARLTSPDRPIELAAREIPAADYGQDAAIRRHRHKRRFLRAIRLARFEQS